MCEKSNRSAWAHGVWRLNAAYVDTLDHIWAQVRPGAAPWRYPAEVLRAVEEVAMERAAAKPRHEQPEQKDGDEWHGGSG